MLLISLIHQMSALAPSLAPTALATALAATALAAALTTTALAATLAADAAHQPHLPKRRQCPDL